MQVIQPEKRLAGVLSPENCCCGKDFDKRDCEKENLYPGEAITV